MVFGPLGHSPPSIHWWLSLTAADQGAWISGLGAFAAAAVALLISLGDGRRRKAEAIMRSRVAMANFYSPAVGIYAMIDGMERDTAVVAAAKQGDAVRAVAPFVERLKYACDVMRPILASFSPAEAFYLQGDLGTSVAAAIRDAQLLEGLVTSVTEKYLPALEVSDLKAMHRVASSLRTSPALARAIKKRLLPFIDACKVQLGEIEDTFAQ